MEIFPLWVGLSIAVGMFAHNHRGRNGLAWFFDTESHRRQKAMRKAMQAVEDNSPALSKRRPGPPGSDPPEP